MTMQTTLFQSASLQGVGLHSGETVRLSIKGAPADTGLVFVRSDLDNLEIPVNLENVDFAMLKLATTLRKDGAMVQTTEHVLSALYGAGIDNAFITVDGPEVPIMDGSAEPFYQLIEEAGVRTLTKPRQVMRITKAFSFEQGGKRCWVEPSKDFKVSYEIDFDHNAIGNQQMSMSLNARAYSDQVASARTFGFMHEVNYLKSKGLIKGGSTENAIVLDESGIVNGDLRFNEEFVAHKILDYIGDLAVAGMQFQGHFSGYKAGHEMHALFLQALLENPDHFEVVTADAVEYAA
jgi:UDP-3-O-[3-hydroxymyristoyl] N-acetylglucosamine deacetylase